MPLAFKGKTQLLIKRKGRLYVFAVKNNVRKFHYGTSIVKNNNSGYTLYMAQKILKSEFFERDARIVAKALLGKFLARRIGNKVSRHYVLETEAYIGPNDLASHASKGRTRRTEVMFGPPGYAYVYLIYGMYWCLNAVTGKDGHPAAVLIRAIDAPNAGGPGKLTQLLRIGRRENTKQLLPQNGLWFEDSKIHIPYPKIVKSPRIGVDYAGDWRERPYRYTIDPTWTLRSSL